MFVLQEFRLGPCYISTPQCSEQFRLDIVVLFFSSASVSLEFWASPGWVFLLTVGLLFPCSVPGDSGCWLSLDPVNLLCGMLATLVFLCFLLSLFLETVCAI